MSINRELSSRDQAQLDDDREFAPPDDFGRAAGLRQRQRALDHRDGRTSISNQREAPAAALKTSPSRRVDPSTLPVAASVDYRPRLLIADDDPVVRTMLEMSLAGRFNVVGTAADSEEAIELARDSQPDAAIVDVEMPKGGGLCAVRGIVDVAPSTAIVVLSGDESDTAVRELMAAGAIAYRRKGVAPEILAESLIDSIEVHARDLHHLDRQLA